MATVIGFIRSFNVVKRLNDRLSLLKVWLPFSEADHVLALAFNLYIGGSGSGCPRWSCPTPGAVRRLSVRPIFRDSVVEVMVEGLAVIDLTIGPRVLHQVGVEGKVARTPERL